MGIGKLLIAGTFALFCVVANATPDCKKTGSKCIDQSPTKNIGGVIVPLEKVNGCWEYEDTYECIKPGAVDYCATISSVPGCSQTDTKVKESAFDGTPLIETRFYTCSDSKMTTPVGTTKLDSSYTVNLGGEVSTCSAPEGNPSCLLVSHICDQYEQIKVIEKQWVDEQVCTAYSVDVPTDCVSWITQSVLKDVEVTKNGQCLKWNDTYSCISQKPEDYCLAVASTSGCSLVSSTCDSRAWNGTCNSYTRQYNCGNDVKVENPGQAVLLNTSYTITRDEIDSSKCSGPESATNCARASKTCKAGPETRVINGLAVYKDCWEWSIDYMCSSDAIQGDCKNLEEQGCALESETCIDTLKGSCLHKSKIYNCMTAPGKSTTVKDCGSQIFCLDGKCDDISYQPDPDFAKNAALMEAQRQAGMYFDAVNQTIFNGVSEKCTKGWGGLKNCCGNTTGGKSNYTVISAVMQGAKIAVETTMNYGSRFTFDYMYPEYAGWSKNALSALLQVGGAESDTIWKAPLFTPTNFNPSFNMYGFTATFGGASSSLAGNVVKSSLEEWAKNNVSGSILEGYTAMSGAITSSTKTIVEGSATGGFSLSFNPYMFAASVAMQMVMDMMSCTQQEQALSMHKGSNLCIIPDPASYCSKEVNYLFGKVCLETTQSYCCFNSKLAKIINEQGRKQIGKGYGSAKNRECKGFNVQEFQQLDFSKMDLSEFINEIMENVQMPDATAIQSNAQNKVNSKVQNYYNMGGR